MSENPVLARMNTPIAQAKALLELPSVDADRAVLERCCLGQEPSDVGHNALYRLHVRLVVQQDALRALVADSERLQELESVHEQDLVNIAREVFPTDREPFLSVHSAGSIASTAGARIRALEAELARERERVRRWLPRWWCRVFGHDLAPTPWHDRRLCRRCGGGVPCP